MSSTPQYTLFEHKTRSLRNIFVDIDGIINVSSVSIWNEEIEEIIRTNPQSLFQNFTNLECGFDQSHVKDNKSFPSTVSQLSELLSTSLIISIKEGFYRNVSDETTEEYHTLSISRGEEKQSIEIEKMEADMEEGSIKRIKLAQWLESTHIGNDEGAENDFELSKQFEIATYLRSIKNLLRCMHHYIMLFPLGSSQNEQTKTIATEIFPLKKLKEQGMIALYLTLLHLFSTAVATEKAKPSTVADNKHFHSIARYASHALFHSAYGSNDVYSQEAKSFLHSKILNSIPIVMKIILYPNDASFLTSMMKLVHNMLGTNMSLYSDMNNALKKIVQEKWNVSVFTYRIDGTKNEKHPLFLDEILPDKSTDADSFPIDTLEAILVLTLSNTVRDGACKTSQSSSSFYEASATDLRPELAMEILNILFIIQTIHNKTKNNSKTDNKTDTNEKEREKIMTQIGILLTEILLLPHAKTRIYKLKLAVVNLLLDAPDSYAPYLIQHKTLPQLWTILEFQLNEVVSYDSVGSSTKEYGKSKDASILLPILLVWKKLTKAHPDILNFCCEKIFPSHPESAQKSCTSTAASKVNKMAPVDAPKGTIRYKLIKLMTWIDTNIKRAASELLWIVCGEDPAVFIRRTGFGNAVHLLGLKGLLNLPSEPNIG